MNIRILNVRLLAVTVAALCCLSSIRAEMRYNIVPIGPSDYVTAYGMNNAGDVVGTLDNAVSYTAFLYSDASGIQPIAPLYRYDRPVPGAINDSRQMVIEEDHLLYQYSATVGYNQIGDPSPGAFPGSIRGAPRINNAGQVIVTVDAANPGGGGGAQATLITPGVGERHLGFLNGNPTWANGLNNQGWVVGGSMNNAGGQQQALLWRDGVGMTPLNMKEAFSINDSGDITGVTDSLQPVVMRNGQLLPINITGDFVGTLHINNQGLVVGTTLPGLFLRPYVWSESSGTTDLNSLIDPASGWVLREALAINDNGQILGWGEYGGHQRAFRLDLAVPEPGTWALLGLGSTLGFIFLRKRRVPSGLV